MAELIKTPHPVTLEGQERIAVHLMPGESLFSLLNRTLGDQLDNERWNVSVAGVEVPVEDWHTCKPKHGQTIEVVGDLGKSALMMVAVIALTIWTGGAFLAVAAGGTALGLGGIAGYAAIMAVQVAGSLLINKVLGPKPPGSPDTTQGPASYSLNSTQNQARQYGAVGLLFGRMRYAPDLVAQMYNYFDHDDMYMAQYMGWGIGVGRVEELRNGDTLLTDYDDAVQVYHAGMRSMPNTGIPLFGATSSQPGGALQQEKEIVPVTRTTAPKTVRIMVNISGSLTGVTRKGKLSMNQETFIVRWRRVGQTNWEGVQNRRLQNDDRRTLRFTMTQDVPEGQYDVQVQRGGQQSKGDGDVCEFSFDTLVSIAKDESDFRGCARSGFTLRANDRLSSQPTAVNGLAIAYPIPVWNGTSWVDEETSNPGAQMLKYMRGYYDEYGNLVAGLGLTDQDIDIEALKGFMVHCRNNGHTYDYWLNREREHIEVLNSIAQAGMGQFTDAGGLMSVSWISEDQPIDGTVNMARIKKGSFRVDYSLTGTADGIECRYWDAQQNKEAMLRVPMPGVTTMLSPAKVTLEGVTTEEQAALMARYHLAQSLYQFKDISFATGLENLTYRRLSLLQMQHDLTQWGYGGVVVGVETVGARLRFTLDEAVPAPAAGKKAYIGIRVPGQRAAAIFEVQPFTGETKQVTLAQPWPSDLPVPGDTTGNPAHDSIWIYDFKETPGLTVRVVNISRAADRGANVSVVVESREFWNYVRTGHYEPAESGSLLNTRPVLSELQVTEQRQVIGDVVQDQLVVSFQVSGPYAETRIYTADQDGSLRERARTDGRNAEFNIPGPGTYTIVAMPYNKEGLRGTGKTVTYSTVDSGVPPVLVDTFDVQEVNGGVRFYTWGFNPDTIQSGDFRGVNIRYIAGDDIAGYSWDDMTPIGDTGYHPIPFEAVIPTSGKYVFACRSVNASGLLSEQARVIVKDLGKNLGEKLDQMGEDNQQSFEEIMQEVRDTQKAVVDEAAAREEAIRQEVTARENAINSVEQQVADQAQALLNEKLTREAEIAQEAATRQSEDESLAYQISQISAGTGDQFDMKHIWYFDTNGDAEGWTGEAGAPTVSDGWMRPVNSTSTSRVTSPVIAFDAQGYRAVKMRVRRSGTPTWIGRLSWATVENPAFDVTRRVTVAEPDWDNNGIGVVDFRDIPWSGDESVNRIELLLTSSQTAAGSVEFDYIAVGRPTPGASVAMVQEERQARIAGDTAEALSRETLALQMRGDYEGTDASSADLKTGLVHSEKLLRIEGDAVLGTRIDSMQVSVDANSAAITEEARVRAAQDEALASDILQLTAQLDDKASATALEALEVRVTETEEGITATATSVQKLSAQLNQPHAGSTAERAGNNRRAGSMTVYSVIATANSATSRKVETLDAEFGQFEGRITQQLEVVTTEQAAQAASIQQLNVKLADKAEASAVNTLTTRVEEVDGRVTAQAQSINQVSARVDGKADASVVQEMSVTVESNRGAVTQINARYFIGVQANGLVGGMYIGNNGQLVNIRFQADKFTIESPSGTGERFEYSGNNIRIYDPAGRLRVRMGVWS